MKTAIQTIHTLIQFMVIFHYTKHPSSDLRWEHQGRWAATCSKNTNVTRLRSAELLNILNLLWMKLHVVPKLVMWQKQDLCWNLFVFLWFLLHFQHFSHLQKWLALELFLTYHCLLQLWLWTMSHQMYLLLTVTVVQFVIFIANFIINCKQIMQKH